MTTPETFTIYRHLPRGLWVDDRTAAEAFLTQMWLDYLTEKGGLRAPGSLLIHPVGYARYAETDDDDLIAEVPISESGPWDVVGVRVTGPAFPPEP